MDILKYILLHKTHFIQHVLESAPTCFSNHLCQVYCQMCSGASGGAGVANSAAVADGVEEAAVAGVAGVAAGQWVTQTRLLVRDTATR